MKRTILFLALISLLLACQRVAPATPAPTATVSPQPTAVLPTAAPTTPPTPAPTATAVPATVELWLGQDWRLNGYPADQPLVFIFSAPMDIHRSANPISISPNLSGEWAWDDSHTILTFTPTYLLNPIPYTIRLSRNLRTAVGQPIEGDTTWQLSSLGFTSVTALPSSNTAVTNPQPTITLSFGRTMDTPSVEDALHITPPLPYTTAWSNNNQRLAITFAEPMQLGVAYTFGLSQTVYSTQGALVRPQMWAYSLAAPSLAVSHPTADKRTDPLTLTPNYPLTIYRGLTQSLQIEPEVAGTWVEGRNAWTFTPTTGHFVSGQVYTLTLTADIALSEEIVFPAGTLATFGPLSPLLSVAYSSFNEDGETELLLRFDQPMEPNSTTAALAFTPAISATYQWDDPQSLRVVTMTELGQSPNAQIRLEPTAAFAATGQTIQQSFSHRLAIPRYAFDEFRVHFGWGVGVQLVDADGRRAVQFARANRTNDPLTNLEITLQPLSEAQFLARLSNQQVGLDYNSWRRFQTSSLEVTHRWTLTNPVSSANSHVLELTIPAEVEPGIYVISLRDQGLLADQLILFMTRQTLVVKQDAQKTLVWVTDMANQPQPNARVQAYTADGRFLATATADANGRAQFDLPPNANLRYVLAQAGNHYAFSGVTSSWKRWSWSEERAGQAYAGTLYTERPIYQPGQTVYYKAILRQEEDALLNNIGTGVTATLTIRDPRNNLIHTETITSNDFGTFNGQLALVDEAMLGTYTIAFQVLATANGRADYSLRHTFLVEEYKKPDYQITITTDKPYYFPGETVTVTVDSHYLFGQPVSGAAVQGVLTFPRYYYQLRTLLQKDGQMDENGRYTFTFPAPAVDDDWWYRDQIPSTSFVFQVTVDDGSQQAVANTQPLLVYATSERLRLNDIPSGFSNTPFRLEGVVEGFDGQPIPERELTLRVEKRNEDSYTYRLLEKYELVTDAEGRVSHTLTLEAGAYNVTLTGRDAGGRLMTRKYYFHIYAEDEPIPSWDRQQSWLTLSLDRTSYAPGDTAQLRVTSTVSGPALLTWERGTMRGSQLVMLTAPLTELPIPVTAADAPNVYLTVSQWVPQPVQSISTPVYESLPDALLGTASINLVVPPNDKRLNLAIISNQEVYQVRQEATFTLQVTNFQGQPVSAEVSLGMVDEAIYSLAEDNAERLWEAFYFIRQNQTSEANALRPTRYLGYGGGGGGGGDDDPAPAPLRAEFPDTAAWFPALRTDANGLVTVTLTLPDSLTSWRLTARAVTADTQIGETTTNITVTQPVLVRPILPRTLTAGDDVLISVMAQNYLTTTVNLELELLSSDLTRLAITDEATQTMAILPDQRRTLGWSLSAEAAGEVQLTVIARQNGVVYDAIQLPLTIQPLAVRDMQAQVGQMTAGAHTLTFNLPPTALPISTVNLELSRSIAGTMLEGLEYLTGFPYGCVEQTMSRALPNAVVGRAFNQLGYNTDLLAGLNEPINAGVQKLYGFQHDDGGWGWWHDDATDGYQTAWVVFGLLNTAEAGYVVSPGVIRDGAEWLLANTASLDVDTRAFALYALARAAQYEGVTLGEESAAFILDQITVLRDVDNAQLNTFSQTALALALWEMGEETAAQDLLDEILATAETHPQTGAIHWSGANGDGYYNRKTMASDTRTTAFVLTAMSQMRPTAAEMGGAVRYLLGRRQAQGWGTTNETAFAILALTDYLLAQRTTQGDTPFNYTVQVNGQTVAQGRLTPTAESITIPLPLNLLDTGANEITLTHDGVGPLYYALRNEWYLAQTSIEAAGSLTVKRTYWDAAGKSLDLANTEIGQLVLVRLEVTTPKDLSYVIIEDKLPGALEALNSRLNSQPRALSYWESPTYYWQEYGYNYKEVFPDRVSFFVTELGNGRHIYEYTARITHTGQFTALPAEAYAMYDLEQWGRSASALWGGE